MDVTVEVRGQLVDHFSVVSGDLEMPFYHVGETHPLGGDDLAARPTPATFRGKTAGQFASNFEDAQQVDRHDRVKLDPNPSPLADNYSTT